ncbi:MAG: glutathione S-transferase family protein [Hyphomonadaceae bacterium]
MADTLTFYTNPMSRGRIIRWMLEEIGQPYDTQIMGYGTSMKSAEYLAINPMGKVPAIKHGDVVVTEAAAICAYLADAFPQAKLAPPSGSKERGPYYRWLFYGAGPVEAMASNHALGVVIPNDKHAMVGYGSRDAVIDTLEKAVSSTDYLAGSSFTAADLYVGAQIAWGLQFGTIEKRPAFEAYVGRIMSRPAAGRAREIDDKLVAEMQKAG